ncbi:hypothetical protein AXF42_Ash021818 [Apostasia shenzhenica]|uniref:Uncharacterized protein n=1 Tax=Apostasia shenzhenica TaxID=1088818 RepID=A0A2H9ZZT1_9ASPA|nr:hypothetical protein AXF42_Ash021818 [Apostasia shenzhenica]
MGEQIHAGMTDSHVICKCCSGSGYKHYDSERQQVLTARPIDERLIEVDHPGSM